MRSRRLSTIIGSLVNSSNRYCHSQVSWPNVPLVTKNIPLEKKPHNNGLDLGYTEFRYSGVLCFTRLLVIIRKSESLTLAWAKYLYLAKRPFSIFCGERQSRWTSTQTTRLKTKMNTQMSHGNFYRQAFYTSLWWNWKMLWAVRKDVMKQTRWQRDE